MEFSFKNLKKWTFGILGTILLGAIGSGVWEWILSDFFSWLGSSFISLASSLSQTFVDSLYKDVWKGQNFPYLREVYSLTFVTYAMLPAMFGVFARKLKSNNNNASTNNKRPNLYILIVIICAAGVMMTIKIWQTSFTARVASTLQSNTIILGPYITSSERIELESNFSVIETELKAIELKNKLVKFALKHQVKLHDMDFM
jgi:hypothetical protein